MMEGLPFALKTFIHRLVKSAKETQEIAKMLEGKKVDEEEAMVKWTEVVSDTFNSTRRARSFINRSLTFSRKKSLLRAERAAGASKVSSSEIDEVLGGL